MQQPPEGNYQRPSQLSHPSQQPYSGYLPQQSYPPQYTPPPGYPPRQPGYPSQLPYYPQQPPLPPKKKLGKGWLIGLGVVILALFVCIAASHGSSSSSTTTVTNTSDTTQSQPTQAPTVAPKPQTWTTVQSFKGNGERKTAIFSVPDDWKVDWTCNPSSFMGSSYNVMVTVYNSDGTLSDLAINSICQGGTTSGTTEEHQAGNVYLDISSEGDWTVNIQELK